MNTTNSVECLVNELNMQFPNNSFEYADPTLSFSEVARHHFREVSRPLYGVYLVRKRETHELVYVGKGGTIDAMGRMKTQDLPARLVNVKDGSVRADIWFRSLVEECGPVVIEYIVTGLPITPAVVEAQLLQAFLADNQRLPLKNKSL